jgi:LuxR family transcriptional regulator, maltose regulon positive regulatory protein
VEITGLAHWGMAASFRSSALAAKSGRRAIERVRRHGWAGEPLVAIANPMLDGSLIWQGELDEAERWLMEGEYALQSEIEPATEMLLHLLAFAVLTSQIHGIWGCTTERERAAVRRSTLSQA